MTLKSIVALADASDEDHQTLGFAAELASVFGAAVKVVPAARDAAVEMINLGTALGAPFTVETAEALSATHETQIWRIQQACRAACRAHDVAFGADGELPRMTVIDSSPTPWLRLSREISLTDLVIVGQEYLESSLHITGVLDDLLLNLRAPVLVARGKSERLIGDIAIAWDGSREAGRAVRAALPLLRRAARIVIVQNTAGVREFDTDADPAALVEYLKIHGVAEARTHLTSSKAEAEAESLLAVAREENANLVVAGAYSHAKVVEQILGGVTRTMLQTADGPSLLLSH